MPFKSKKSKRKGWYGNKSRRYTEKEYKAEEQLTQADKNWIIVNYNQFRKQTYGSLISETTRIVPREYRDNREIAQAISHSYVNCHPVFDQLDALYEYLSRKNDRELRLDNSFRSLIRVLQQHIWWLSEPAYFNFSENFSLPRPSENLKPGPPDRFLGHFIYIPNKVSVRKLEPQLVEKGGQKTVLLAFSGGRGSLATALFYKEHGFDVRLFHVCGINREAGDEYEFAKAQAERIELPFYVHNVALNDGYFDEQYMEHPLKNIAICNAMIHFCLDHQLPPHIAFGTYEMDRLAYNCFAVCGAECKEMFEAYEKIVKPIIPDFRISTPLSHEGMAIERLIRNPGYLDMTTSCATSKMLRRYGQARVKKFFGIDVHKQDCGVCWKCAKDYIFRCDYGFVEEPNYHYYIICITILKAQFDGERGYPCFSIYDIWNRFFFYNISKSKFHEELRKAKVRETGNISFPDHVVEEYYRFNAFKRVSSI